MKMKTSELTGAALDWAVAKCEGKRDNDFGWWWDNYKPSTDWAQSGPIIERERIETRYDRTGRFSEPWIAATLERMIIGPTPLIAAMRCYVASKLGDEVEIPEELT
jgi:hypothetical protein